MECAGISSSKVRTSARLQHTNMSSIPTEITGICPKGLVSCEAKHHSSYYHAFVSIDFTSARASADTPENTESNGIYTIYETVLSFSVTLISEPRMIEKYEQKHER